MVVKRCLHLFYLLMKVAEHAIGLVGGLLEQGASLFTIRFISIGSLDFGAAKADLRDDVLFASLISHSVDLVEREILHFCGYSGRTG